MTQRPDKVSLDPPVGEIDHVRGVVVAPVPLVEYGDYECPHCGRANPVVQELQRRVGDGLRFELARVHEPRPGEPPITLTDEEHCYILEHEDRDMMRPIVVTPGEIMGFMSMPGMNGPD